MQKLNRHAIVEIHDSDFKKDYVSPLKMEDYDVRNCARGILLRDGKMAILYVSKWNYHKLPGGGVEDGEEVMTAFKREVREETGCDCMVLDDQAKNPVIVEYRDEFKLCQINHLLAARIVGEPKEVAFTGDEIEEGFKLLWVSLDQIDAVLQGDNPTNYEGKFIQKRDRAIIDFYKDLITSIN